MYKLSIIKITNSSDLNAYKKQAKVIIDELEEQLLELFLVRNPQFRFNKNYKNEFSEFKLTAPQGVWIYFPWNSTLVHLLPEKEFFELRTARNRDLITLFDQEKYYNSTVGIAGLSVGSHAALTITMTGGAKNIKVADFDKISVSNLNRLRYGTTTLNSSKADLAASLIAEMNPYANIYVYHEGVTAESVKQFLGGTQGEPRCDVLVEGVDNLEMKIVLRQEAKKASIPVIMATDNGDGIIVDVERYDLDKDLQLFNGALGDFTLETFKNFPPHELPKLATTVAGPQYIVPAMLSSLLKVGKSLYSWPQLGTAATFTGVVSAYLVRALITGKKIMSGKYDINLENIFDADLQSQQQKQNVETERKKLLKILGL